jgi:hypothetical protein
MNLPEIYWSAKEGEDSDLDLIPGRVTRVERLGMSYDFSSLDATASMVTSTKAC